MDPDLVRHEEQMTLLNRTISYKGIQIFTGVDYGVEGDMAFLRSLLYELERMTDLESIGKRLWFYVTEGLELHYVYEAASEYFYKRLPKKDWQKICEVIEDLEKNQKASADFKIDKKHYGIL